MSSTQTTTADGPKPQPRVRWLHVAVFYAIACGVSWPFFWWRDMEPASFKAWHVPGLLKTASYMWGPGIAGLICLLLFRKTHRRTITLLGTSPLRSLALYVGPWLLLAALGGPDREGISGHMFPLILIVMGAFTILGEEIGWRGFLEDALRPLRPLYRYLLIGFLWEFWHFTTRTRDKTIVAILISLAIMGLIGTLLSWLIGKAMDRSRSVLVATMIHGLVDACFEFAYWQARVAIAVAVIGGCWLLWTWPKQEAR